MSRFRDLDGNPGDGKWATTKLRGAQEWRHKCDREVRAQEEKIHESARCRRTHGNTRLPFDEDKEEGEEKDESRSEAMPVLNFQCHPKPSHGMQVGLPDPLSPMFDDGEVEIGVEGGGNVDPAQDCAF